jgi:hypothetical protein
MAAAPLFAELQGLLAEIGRPKQANAAADPGGMSGSSSHPTASADAGLQTPPHGARAAENEADVKKDIPNNVNTTPGNTGTQAEVQLGQGVKADETGVNVPSTKGNKEDPGTATPITTEDGTKYGSFAGRPFDELYKQAGVLANDLLAAVAVQGQKQAQARQTPAPAPVPAPTPAPAPSAESVKAAEAGFNLAQQIANAPTPEQVKAANARVVARQLVTDGLRAAELYLQFAKAAADASDGGSSDSGPKEKKEGGEGESGESSESSESGEGGEGGGGGGAPAGLGGPPEGGMGLGGMGGSPEGGMGGPPDPAIVEQLMMALLEAGYTPEMLMQGIQGLADGGGAPMPGGGGGAPGGDPLAAMAGGGSSGILLAVGPRCGE